MDRQDIPARDLQEQGWAKVGNEAGAQPGWPQCSPSGLAGAGAGNTICQQSGQEIVNEIQSPSRESFQKQKERGLEVCYSFLLQVKFMIY